MRAEGKAVSIAFICKLLDYPRRSFYYKSKARQKVVDEALALKVKALIEESPELGYRRVSYYLEENRKKIQRIFQIKGWQVRKRAVGKRPRIQALKSESSQLNERWATDLANVWCGSKDRWARIALVIDCYNRELIGWRLSRRGNAKTAEAALEEALINRFGYLGTVPGKLQLRSDNGLVFTSQRYTKTVKDYNIEQEFITPYSPQQNGMIERFIKTLKEECIWKQRFESLAHARDVIGKWITKYNHHRPHMALGYQTPVAFKHVQNIA